MTLDPPSPCIGVCRLAEDEPVCAGCHRTMGEITNWFRLTEAEKYRVLAAIRERQLAHKTKAETPQIR